MGLLLKRDLWGSCGDLGKHRMGLLLKRDLREVPSHVLNGAHQLLVGGLMTPTCSNRVPLRV